MSNAGDSAGTVAPVIDIRTYRLVPGGKEAFDRVARSVLPMLERYGIRVVACGPSADPGDDYVLIRAFSSAAERDEQLGAFYASDEWNEKYRDAVLDLIENYHVVAIELTVPMAEMLSWAVGLVPADIRSLTPSRSPSLGARLRELPSGRRPSRCAPARTPTAT
jgi:hypothetical protein